MRTAPTIVLVLLSAACGANHAAPQAERTAGLPPPGKPLVGAPPPMPSPVSLAHPPGVTVEDWVTGLEVPWDVAFLGDGRALISERPGRVRLVAGGRLQEKAYAEIDGAARGEGGLLGIAAHPGEALVYVMYTYRSGGRTLNRISRFTDTGSTLAGERVVLEAIPGARYHNGGALRFGPDGNLWIGTGDAGEPELAQDRSSLAGKILRLTPDGAVPADNPFAGSPVWAYGLRNVQGLAWDEQDRVWATTHGPSGEFGLRAKDAVYRVEKGGNHGWPRVLGVSDVPGVVDPVLFFPDEAVPPALAAFAGGDLFFATLGSQHLVRVGLAGERVERLERWFITAGKESRYGRLRAVVVGPDGALYVSTSNRDGRGRPRPGDDRILRITLPR